MTEEQPRTRLDIRTAQDLFDALQSGTTGQRLSVIQAISQQPERSLAYGSHQGQDVIDVMLEQIEQGSDPLLRKAMLGAIVNYDDPRVADLFLSVFEKAADQESVVLAARRLAIAPSPAIRARLGQALVGEDITRVQSAALVLAELEDLSLSEQVRMSLLGHRPAEDVCDRSLEHWCAELNGLYGLQAQQQLRRQTSASFERLASCFDRFNVDVQVWLLTWAAEAGYSTAPEMLQGALASDENKLLVAALSWLPNFAEPTDAMLDRLADLVKSNDPVARKAALQAAAKMHGGLFLDWRNMARNDPEPEVRITALFRWCIDAGQQAIDDLVESIENESNWRVRAAATQCLAALGADGVERAKKLALQGHENARIAAFKVLLHHDEGDWLKKHLPPPPTT